MGFLLATLIVVGMALMGYGKSGIEGLGAGMVIGTLVVLWLFDIENDDTDQ